MLARVAESLYWLSRYSERAENMARLINVYAHLLLDLPRSVAPGWNTLISISGAREDYQARHQDFDERSVVHYLIADPASTSSIVASLNAARENARTIRDVIPREAWEHINSFALWAREQAPRALNRRERFDFLNEVILRCQTLSGIVSGSMNHDQRYLFFRLGRRLERADMTTRIIDVRAAGLMMSENGDVVQNFDGLQWMSVLKSLTGYQMYRQSMNARVQRAEVLKFLFHSEVFPRAVARCLVELEQDLQKLPRNGVALAGIARVKQQLKADVVKMNQAELHQFIDQLQIGFNGIGTTLADTYFWSGQAGSLGLLRSVA